MTKASKPSPSKSTDNWPAGFLWGASTSSYQIEGAWNEDGRAPSVWDTHCRQKGRVNNEDTGDTACDHYHRYPEDIRLMQDIGIAAYRFSIAWPRVLPRGRGAANEKGLDFYDRLIDALLKAKIEPWICLYHWDMPQCLEDLGGWTVRDSAGWFSDYTTLVARRYGDRVRRWASFNEQNVSTLFGFAMGWSPPGITDKAAYYRAVHHQNLAHGEAIAALRSLVPNASLGVIHNRQIVYPDRKNPAHEPAVAPLDAHWNKIFPDPQILGCYPAIVADDVEPYMHAGDLTRICQPLDWFGLNHYGPMWAKLEPNSVLGFHVGASPDDMPHSEIGWAIYPEAFHDELLDTHKRYRLPVYVTENGCGSNKEKPDKSGTVTDKHRIAYLRDYTAAMAQAIRDGADVRGYFVWSLLDNFEWGSGYANRFGIVRVDFDTQKRTPKASSRWYADLIRNSSGKSSVGLKVKPRPAPKQRAA
jgi:beta-glucosidase